MIPDLEDLIFSIVQAGYRISFKRSREMDAILMRIENSERFVTMAVTDEELLSSNTYPITLTLDKMFDKLEVQ